MEQGYKRYKIIGNINYLIDTNRKIINTTHDYIDGTPKLPDLIEDGDMVTITIFGITKTVTKEWLYWLSFFKLELPGYIGNHVFDIEFKDNGILMETRYLNPKVVVYKNPVEVYLNGVIYRAVARFPNYAVAENGDVLNMYNFKVNKYLTHRKSGYPNTSIVDQAGLYITRVRARHILVALAWISNDDYVSKPIIDHIDNNKKNPHANNLQWVSYSTNSRNFRDGDELRVGYASQSGYIYTRNIDTGKITRHTSIASVARQLGYRNFQMSELRHCKKWRGKNGNYEVSIHEDKWCDRQPTVSKHYMISTSDGKNYSSLDEFRRKVLDTRGHHSLQVCIDMYRKKYPNKTLEINDELLKKRKYRVSKNGNEIDIVDTQTKVGNILGVKKYVIQRLVKNRDISYKDDFVIETLYV